MVLGTDWWLVSMKMREGGREGGLIELRVE